MIFVTKLITYLALDIVLVIVYYSPIKVQKILKRLDDSYDSIQFKWDLMIFFKLSYEWNWKYVRLSWIKFTLDPPRLKCKINYYVTFNAVCSTSNNTCIDFLTKLVDTLLCFFMVFILVRLLESHPQLSLWVEPPFQSILVSSIS